MLNLCTVFPREECDVFKMSSGQLRQLRRVACLQLCVQRLTELRDASLKMEPRAEEGLVKLLFTNVDFANSHMAVIE